MVVGGVVNRESIEHKSDDCANARDCAIENDCTFANSALALCHELKQQIFTSGKLIRVECRIPDLDPLTWLQNNPDADTAYWANRDNTLVLSGLGIAHTLVADSLDAIPGLFNKIRTLLHSQTARFVGGIGFNAESLREEWKEHPFGQFVLPQIEVTCRDDQYWLAANIVASNASLFAEMRDQAIKRLDSLEWNRAVAGGGLTNVGVVHKHSTPNRKQWSPLFNDALAAIERGQFDKVVLSREVHLTLSEATSPVQILKQWSRKNSHSYAFCLQNHRNAFLGCSPEQLYSRHHRYLNTEAIAGTVLRGVNEQCDSELAEYLIHDPKLRREHKVVVDYIVRQLSELSETASTQAPLSVLKLAKVQHLQVPLRAKLKPDVNDCDILLKLHPTPAVCGSPRQAAMDFIDQNESAPRGWYAGAVGVVSDSETEFAVAIRSLLLKEKSILCYSGVGLVDGSEEDAEWSELGSKIETLLSLFDS